MFDLQLLGPVELRREADDHVGLGQPQQRCLLAVLAMSPGHSVAMESIIDRVWGQEAPAHVRDVVYTYVSRLRTIFRQAGTPAALRRSDGGYLLDVPADRVDVHRARALARRARRQGERNAVELFREATGLWRGAPLAGLPGGWAARTREALIQERITLLTGRFETELAMGRHTEVLEELSDDVFEYPLAEPLTAHLMLALYRSGRQADALAAYGTIRRGLIDDLGEEPGPALRELHQRILRRDPELERPTSPAPPYLGAVDPVELCAVRPTQLPPPLRGFTGRDDELGRLDSLSAAAAETASTCVIVGTAGIGKTALAVHWAHRMADRFPDGHLYVNLRGFDPSGTAVRPDQALRGFLEAFGLREEQFPSNTDGLSALFRSVLADRRMLLVLDNARDLEQIQPLLPAAPGCLTLVTSRHELPGMLTAGATQLGVQLLTPGEARQMLVRRLGAHRVDSEPGAIDEITAHCAGLPLALAVVAAHATARPDFPLSALAEELSDEDCGLAALSGGDAATDIRAVFSWSYRCLSAESARLFRLTGLHAGPDLGISAAAHLAGCSRARTRALLTELTRASLLTEHAPGRFSSHDLLHAYAAELAEYHDSDEVRRVALKRVLDYYLHSAHFACRANGIHLYMETPGPPLPTTAPERFTDAVQAVKWLSDERRALAAAVGLAARTGHDAYAARLSRWLCTYLDRQGRWHEQAELLDTAMQAAVRLGDPVEQAHGLADLARACIRGEHFEQAHCHLKQALELFDENKDSRGRARVHNYLAYVHELHGMYDEALHHSLRLLELERIAGNPPGVGRALNSVGWRHVLRGDHERALTYLHEALALQESFDDRHGTGLTLDSLGLAHHNRGDWQQAINYYQRALKLLQSPAATDLLTAATTLVRLGDTQRSMGELEAAHEAWRRALHIFEELQHPRAEELRARLM